MKVLTGGDFFRVDLLTWRGLATYYVLFFLHRESRRLSNCGVHDTPRSNVDGTDRTCAAQESRGYLKYMSLRAALIHDTKFCASFRTLLAAEA